MEAIAAVAGRACRAITIRFLTWRARVHGQRFADYRSTIECHADLGHGADCGHRLRSSISTRGHTLLNKRNESFDALAKWDKKFADIWKQADRGW